MVAMIIIVATAMVFMLVMAVVVNMVVMVDWTGLDRTGQEKLTFKLDFPGNLWPAALQQKINF